MVAKGQNEAVKPALVQHGSAQGQRIAAVAQSPRARSAKAASSAAQLRKPSRRAAAMLARVPGGGTPTCSCASNQYCVSGVCYACPSTW